MKIFFASNPTDFKIYTTDRIREDFLVENLMTLNEINLAYSHFDRMIIGGVVPLDSLISLTNPEELKANYFLERREMGVINTGGDGFVEIDEISYNLSNSECIYIPKGTQKVTFGSDNNENPAKFYICSTPAHSAFPIQTMNMTEASPVELGNNENANQRTIYKYIHNEGIKSCQLVMGLTKFKEGSIWNSVPPHTHTRRMEAYFYFDLPKSASVFHFMGQPQETRHLILGNEQAVISPPWSVHFGVGTASYSFIWAMAGENKEFTDMDGVSVRDLR